MPSSWRASHSIVAGVLVAGGLVWATGVAWPWRRPLTAPAIVVDAAYSDFSDALGRRETVSDVLARAGVTGRDYAAFLAAAKSLPVRRLRPGLVFAFRRLKTESAASRVSVRLSAEQRLSVARGETGWGETVEYTGDDERLPESVRAFNKSIGLNSLAIAPLVLPSRNLGWIALSTADADLEDGPWRRLLLEATARQATLALHQSRLAEQSRIEARHQAVLEERNRLARDIHDTLAQGFAGILMQLQSVQRCASSLPPNIARSIDNAVDLARSHMIEARRSVGALRPPFCDLIPVETAAPSVKPNFGSWQDAQLTVSSAERRLSK